MINALILIVEKLEVMLNTLVNAGIKFTPESNTTTQQGHTYMKNNCV